MKVHIDIDTKTFVRFWLVVIGFILAGFILYSARQALIIILASIFLALALNAPVSLIAKKLPSKSRVGATAISYLAVVAILCAIVFLVIPPIVQQTSKFIQTVPSLAKTVTQQSKGIGVIINKYHLKPQIDNAISQVSKNVSSWVTGIGQAAISSIWSFVSFIGNMVMVFVITFLMLIEGPKWIEAIWGVYDNEDVMNRHKKIIGRMHKIFDGYIVGQLTVSSLDSLAAGLAVFIISLFFGSIPHNLAMPTIAIVFLCSLIPMFGAMISGTIVCLLLIFNSIPAALIYLIYFIIYQQLEANFISPSIQSKRLLLTPLAIIIAVTIGFSLFGIVGGIISIPIAGCVRVLIDSYLENKREERYKTKEQSSNPLISLANRIKKVKE
jgi:predicted PurR-regulated permease PerM